jgi:phosphopantothenoylcysteine decarboxylase / phosphopantothenate---cysteine ligase
MRILITAGPTREYLDDVRFISNASSGKMGYALAAEAARRGHEVILVSGPVALPAPAGVECVPVLTGDDMLQACLEHLEACDGAIMAAAVCDYRPAHRTPGKAPKFTATHAVELTPTADICAALGARKGRRVVVGFALETDDARTRAEEKLYRKHCDAIVLNHPAGIGVDRTTFEIFSPVSGWSASRSGTKAELAAFLVDLLERLASGTP